MRNMRTRACGYVACCNSEETYFGENGLTEGKGKSSKDEIPMNKISSLYFSNLFFFKKKKKEQNRTEQKKKI